jgi:far upstream element-binding protein
MQSLSCNTVTHSFFVLGLLIGPKGATQKQMSESTGAKIVIRGRGASKDGGPSNTNHPDDTDELHVSLEGSDEAVARAAAEIEALLHNPEHANKLKMQQLGHANSASGGAGADGIYGPGAGGAGEPYQIELRVPNNMVGLIIGKGGENIVRIQTQLGVHAQIAKEHEMLPGETLRSIVLKGSPAGVNEAKVRIDEIINAQLAKLSGGGNGGAGGMGGGAAGGINPKDRELDNAFVVKLPVPNDKVGIIIGKGGLTIKGIQERTRAHVQIPSGPEESDPTVRVLSIGGDTKESVDAAQMEIFMALQQQAQQAQSQSAGLNMLVPDDKVGIIIGKGGATVKDIQNRLRVRVQIPQVPDMGSYPPMRTIRYASLYDTEHLWFMLCSCHFTFSLSQWFVVLSHNIELFEP